MIILADIAKKYLDEKDYIGLKNLLLKMQRADIIEVMEDDEVTVKEALIIFRLLKKDDAAFVFSEIDSELRGSLARELTDADMKDFLKEMFVDDLVDALEEMPSNAVKKILRNTSPEDREAVNQILSYPEDSAGSIMTTEYVSLKKDMKVRDALEYINKTAPDKVTIYTCYVTDPYRKLLGYVSLRELISQDYEKTIEEIMEEDVIYVRTLDDQEKVSDDFKKYDFDALPVVDEEKRIVGIITADEIISVIDEENEEDFKAMAGVSSKDEGYLDVSFLTLSKHRIFWLLALMVSATISGSIINSFEIILGSQAILNVFIPMLMGTGGNSGSQASTVVIRSMALGEITNNDTKRVFLKELEVSLIAGIILAAVNFLKIVFVDRAGIYVALVVSITLIFTVVTAMIIGAVLPIIAKKLKQDPAIMAAPLITTIVDATTLIIYFNIAKIVLL